MDVPAIGSVCLLLIALLSELHVGLLADDAQSNRRRNKGSHSSRKPKMRLPHTRTPTPPTLSAELGPRQTAAQPRKVTEFLQILTANYKKDEPPMIDRSTEVRLGIYILSFSYISEQTMDYGVSMYFRQAWRDPRLMFNPGHINKSEVRLRYGSWEQLWIPDTYFRNEKKADFHKVTVRNRLLKLNATGHLWYVIRITAKLSCQMTLQKLPFDRQICPILFESFGYQMQAVYFGWLESPVDIAEELELPQFTLIGTLLNDCSTNYTTGSYPCAEIRFILQRDIGYYVLHVYVPSVLTVMMSWVSFWINIESVPARINLGLLTVVTITWQSSNVNATLPRVSYIKAIDVWLIVCLLYVFCALLEYAFVNVAVRTGVRVRTPIVRQASLRAALEHSDLISSPIRRRRRSRNFFYTLVAVDTRPAFGGRNTVHVDGGRRGE